MTTIPIKSEVSLHDLLQSVEQLDAKAFENFYQKIVGIKARKSSKQKALSSNETELLLKINTIIPAKLQNKIDELNRKKSREGLNESEREELIKLLFKTEELGAERLEYLMQLAKIRNISVRELIKKMELTPHPIAE